MDLWRCDGSYVGFRKGDGVWSASGRYLGRCVGGDVFSSAGAYLGEILLPDRLVSDPRKHDRQTTPSSKGSQPARTRARQRRRSMPSDLRDFPRLDGGSADGERAARRTGDALQLPPVWL